MSPSFSSTANRNLYLTGYRGSGKSTVARILSARLGLPCVDSDEAIENRAGMTIRAIFEMEKEAGFRDRETEILELLGAEFPTIVALGGGAILRPQNRTLIRSRGRVVWLKASPQELHRRIAGDATTAERRPALTRIAGYDEIVQLLAAREPIYEEVSDLVVSTDHRKSEEIAEEIVAWWNARTA